MQDTNEPLVVVFGGAGYIGSILTKLLLENKFRVRVFDNFTYGRESLAGINSPNLEIVEGDLCDTVAVSEATKGADAVVLLAGIVGHHINEIKRNDVRNVNYFASSVVLDAAIEHGASRFIFASSSSVYGIQQGVMYETTIPEPVSLYCRLKLRMEQRVIDAKRRHFHPTALRIATCHGHSSRMRFDLAGNTFIRDAVTKKELTIYSGEQCRSFIHVTDVARAILLALRAHENLVTGHVFNVGAADQNIQINQLANLVKSLVPETKIKVRQEDPDITGQKLSTSKIEKVLDFTPQVTLEQSLAQVRDYLVEGNYGDPYSLQYLNT